MARSDAQRDPLAIRNQPALLTGRRRRWLIPAAILGVLSIGMLAATLTLQILIPWTGIVLEVTLFLIMVVCALTMREVHRRNLAFAWLMAAMAAVPTIALILITVGEARGR